jgi:DNA-directed RNA polymerase subunit RPC12/RpoP
MAQKLYDCNECERQFRKLVNVNDEQTVTCQFCQSEFVNEAEDAGPDSPPQ